MSGWHCASAVFSVVYYFDHGLALCNDSYMPGRYVGPGRPEDRCRMCVAKLRPGWGMTRLGVFYHFFDGISGTCGCRWVGFSDRRLSPEDHYHTCCLSQMRRFSIHPQPPPCVDARWGLDGGGAD